MRCYNSPNYNYNYYNNGAWENSCGGDVNSCRPNQNICHQPNDSPNCQRITYIFSNIIEVESLPQGVTWTGCINVNLTTENIKVTYVDSSKITNSLPIINDIYGVPSVSDAYSQFNIINSVNYTSYSCQTFSEALLNIDLSNILAGGELGGTTYTPSSFTVALPFKMNSVEQPLNLVTAGEGPQLPQLPQPQTTRNSQNCGIPPINNSLCTINYCYSGFCNNITLTILSINITLISPLPINTLGCYTY